MGQEEQGAETLESTPIGVVCFVLGTLIGIIISRNHYLDRWLHKHEERIRVVVKDWNKSA